MRVYQKSLAEHIKSTRCSGCKYCDPKAIENAESYFRNALPPVEGSDPALEFETSDIFIKEYFRRLREDVLEPLPVVFGNPEDFCTPNIQAMLRRRVFITANGRLGLGPRRMRAGDRIAIISGGSMPFVVRDLSPVTFVRSPDGNANVFHRRYNLIGPSYVHGLMKGEGVPMDIILEGSEVKSYNYKWSIIDLV